MVIVAKGGDNIVVRLASNSDANFNHCLWMLAPLLHSNLSAHNNNKGHQFKCSILCVLCLFILIFKYAYEDLGSCSLSSSKRGLMHASSIWGFRYHHCGRNGCRNYTSYKFEECIASLCYAERGGALMHKHFQMIKDYSNLLIFNVPHGIYQGVNLKYCKPGKKLKMSSWKLKWKMDLHNYLADISEIVGTCIQSNWCRQSSPEIL